MTATNDKQKLPREMDELQLFTIGGTCKSFCADLAVNDKQLPMEIDNGAAVSDILKALSRIISTTVSQQSGRSQSISPVQGPT